MLSKLGMMDANEATEKLTATLNGYKFSASQATDVVDKLVNVDLIAATSAEELATALQYVASQSSSAGISFDKMIGLIAVGSETTRLSAETIGNTWKSVLARMEQVKAGVNIDEEGESINNVEKVLSKFGIQLRDSTSEFRNMEDVLDEVGNKWNTFDSVAQAQIATAIAGTHRINTFIATMENYDTVLKYTEESQDAAGTSAQKYTAYMDSIDAKLNTLTATWEQFVNNLNQSGTFKSVIDLGTKLIGVLDTLINKMGLLKVALPAAAIMLVSTKLLQLVKYLQNLGNAANKVQAILKPLNSSADVTSETIQSIATELAGLSVKQRMTLLSTKKLTSAQQEEALVASGVSKETAAAAVANNIYGVSAAGASGGVFSLSAAVKGLTAAIAANPIGIALTVITTAVSGIIWAVDAYNQKIQETIDKAHELEDTYSNFTKESKSSINSLTDVKDEFERLSAGVSDYGENISLSTEDYKRYKEIVAQVLEYTPELQEGYSDEGEAIANKNGLIEESIRLLKLQQQTELERFVSKDLPDIAEGRINEYKKAVGALDKAVAGMADELMFSISYQMNSDEVDALRGKAREFFDLAEGDMVSFTVLAKERTVDMYNFIMQNTDFFTDKQIQKIKEQYGAYLEAVQQEKELSDSLVPSLQIIPQMVDGYSELNGATKSFITQYIKQFEIGRDTLTKTFNSWVDDIKSFTSLLVSAGPEVQQKIAQLFSLDKTQLSADTYQKLAKQYIDEILEAIYGTEQSEERAIMEQKLKVKLGIVVVDADGKEIDTISQMREVLKERYSELFKAGAFDDFTKAELELAVNVDPNGIENIDQLKEAMHNLQTQAQNTENAIDPVSNVVTNFADKMKDLESKYSTLKTAVDEFNNSGHISASTLKALSENDLIQYLEIVNGKVQINTEALSENVAKAKAKAKADVLVATYNKLLALSENNVTESSNVAAEAAEDTAKSVGILSSAFGDAAISGASATAILDAWSTTAGKAVPKGNAQDYLNEIKNMQKSFEFIENTDLIGKSGGSSGSSSASSKIKEQKKNIEDLVEAFIKMYKQELKERKEAENAGYEITKRNFEDEKTIMERRFRDVKQHYEDLNKAQEKGAEARLDALEAEYDAYKKKIDAEKDLLKAKKEEEEYEKSLAEKTKDVAKIQSELAKLQFDDSIEAQKKRIELMEQLSDKQGDLDEFQKDHRYDLTEDALEKESDRYKDLYDERKKEIEDEKKAWKDFYDARIDALEREQTRWKDDFEDRKTSEQRAHEDRVNQIESEINDERKLRADAIAAIESRNEEAYNKLIEWNRLYGTGIDYDITQKWNIAKDALDKYGKTGVGIQGILDILAQKIDEISNKTSIAGSSFKTWNNSLNDTKLSLEEIANNMKIVNEQLEKAGAFKGMPNHEPVSNRPGAAKKEFFTKNHTGTDYVAMNANDRLLNKSLGLKSDEVVRILKVGEAVIPKERNLKRLRENSDFVENSSLRRLSELSEVSQGGISDNSSHISISIGDTIVQGDADNNIVNRLNEHKNSLVNEVFSRINKHTNLSGFRSSKRYV